MPLGDAFVFNVGREFTPGGRSNVPLDLGELMMLVWTCVNFLKIPRAGRNRD